MIHMECTGGIDMNIKQKSGDFWEVFVNGVPAAESVSSCPVSASLRYTVETIFTTNRTKCSFLFVFCQKYSP